MHDISFVPFFTELIRRAPSAAHFETDSRFPRTVERTLSKSPLRRVVSWLDTHLMIGALHASATCSVRTMPQCSPATVHWETPDRGVGWLRLVTNGSVDAEADPMRLNARCAFDSSSADAAHVSCAIRCPGVRSIAVDGGRWRLPGINIHVGTDALYEGIRQEGDTLFVRYGLAHGRRSCEMNVELEV